MINAVVWCAMMLGGVPVHAEGVILSKSRNYVTVRFEDGIQAVRHNSCLYQKPEGSSYLPLTRRK